MYMTEMGDLLIYMLNGIKFGPHELMNIICMIWILYLYDESYKELE